jgi:hypothetical protein
MYINWEDVGCKCLVRIGKFEIKEAVIVTVDSSGRCLEVFVSDRGSLLSIESEQIILLGSKW